MEVYNADKSTQKDAGQDLVFAIELRNIDNTGIYYKLLSQISLLFLEYVVQKDYYNSVI